MKNKLRKAKKAEKTAKKAESIGKNKSEDIKVALRAAVTKTILARENAESLLKESNLAAQTSSTDFTAALKLLKDAVRLQQKKSKYAQFSQWMSDTMHEQSQENLIHTKSRLEEEAG